MDKIKRFEIKAKRWPWQPGYNWHGMTDSRAPLNIPLPGEKAAPRFGGGWRYKLGFSSGGWNKSGISVIFDLLFGMVTVTYRTREGVRQHVESDRRWAEWREKRRQREAEEREQRALEKTPF